MSTWRTYACFATEVNKMHLDIIRIWREPLNHGRLPCCGSQCIVLAPAIGQKVQDGLSLVQERYVVWVERIYLRGHMAPAIAPVPRCHNSWGGSGSGGGRGGSGSGSGSGLYGGYGGDSGYGGYCGGGGCVSGSNRRVVASRLMALRLFSPFDRKVDG